MHNADQPGRPLVSRVFSSKAAFGRFAHHVDLVNPTLMMAELIAHSSTSKAFKGDNDNDRKVTLTNLTDQGHT
jgi:hypothetical protein